MPSPKPLPKALKLLRGTNRPDRDNPEAPTPDAALPELPVGTKPEVAAWFAVLRGRLEAIGCASASHTEMLIMAARRLAEVDECDIAIELYGAVYETRNQQGGLVIKSNPAVAQRSEAMRHAHALLAEFGLSLSSVNKVKVPQKTPKSGWSGFGS